MQIRTKTFSWRKDLKLNAAWCFSGTPATVFFFTQTLVTSDCRVKGALTRAMSKRTKHIVSFNEEEDGDTLVEEGSQIERGTVSPRDTRHCETHPKSIRDKRIPREAFFDLGDVKVENVIVTFHD